MTTPYERKRSLSQTWEFLNKLANDRSLRVSKEVRATASSLLRHYPGSSDLALLCERCPELLSETLLNQKIFPVVEDSIKRFITVNVGTDGHDTVDIMPGLDDQAQPCITVIVYMREGHVPRLVSALTPALEKRLRDLGEYRRVLLSFRYISTLFKIKE
jgi:hypothetical protein